MELNELTAISPVDGRYGSKTAAFRDLFSEYGLIKHRVLVEVRWFQALAANAEIAEVPQLDEAATALLNSIVDNFSLSCYKDCAPTEPSGRLHPIQLPHSQKDILALDTDQEPLNTPKRTRFLRR